MTDVEAAWLAGIVDGEGCIRADRAPNGKMYVQVTVTSTYFPLLERVKSLCEVGLFYKVGPTSFTRRPCHQWKVAGSKCLTLLEAVKPFAFVKKQHVDTALLMLELQGSLLPRDVLLYSKLAEHLQSLVKNGGSNEVGHGNTEILVGDVEPVV